MSAPAILDRSATCHACNTTIQWNETVAMAAERMRIARSDTLVVLSGAERLGTIARMDIERCEAQGNWLDSVQVADIARRQAIIKG